MPARPVTSEPAVLDLALGFLVAWAFLELQPRAPPIEALERTPDDLAAPARPFERMSARELRGLSGLGRVRAEEAARARFELGLGSEPRAYDVVRGIGPATVETLERTLEARRGEFPLRVDETYTPPPNLP